MTDKILLGVAHSDDPNEMEEVCRLIDAQNPSSLGLELTETYEMYKRPFTGEFFFYLERVYTKRGVCVVPLDSAKDNPGLKEVSSTEYIDRLLLSPTSHCEEDRVRFHDIVARRDAVMLERILAHQPDVVILGIHHTRSLAPCLPHYRHKDFSEPYIWQDA